MPMVETAIQLDVNWMKKKTGSNVTVEDISEQAVEQTV